MGKWKPQRSSRASSRQRALIWRSPLWLRVDLGRQITIIIFILNVMWYCGDGFKGVTALVLNVALASLGINSAVYDGSWSDYGRISENNKIEKWSLKASWVCRYSINDVLLSLPFSAGQEQGAVTYASVLGNEFVTYKETVHIVLRYIKTYIFCFISSVIKSL